MTVKIFLWLLLVVIATHRIETKHGKPIREKLQTKTMEFLMEQRGIVPHLFAAGPRDSAVLKYPVDALRGRPGAVISNEYCVKRPIVQWNGRKDKFYTLAMSITDYRLEYDSLNNTRPAHYNEYIQWMVANIPGRKIKLGTRLVPYSMPMTRLTNETSYLVFLVYRQQEKFNETVITEMLNPPINNNGSFRIFNFCWKYQMRYPDAGFFYELSYDVNTTTTLFTTTLRPKKQTRKNKKKS